ncbi:hypothetical protein ABEY61_30330 [Bacillus toyonensis]|uniref:hypothetical protein n=1 Tax=Bacillus toyonensis TaxID=155322 RepID=UPI003D193E8D
MNATLRFLLIRYSCLERYIKFGCVAKFKDVASIHSSHDLYHSLRLDYHKTRFTTESDFGVIRFKSNDVELIEKVEPIWGFTLDKQN